MAGVKVSISIYFQVGQLILFFSTGHFFLIRYMPCQYVLLKWVHNCSALFFAKSSLLMHGKFITLGRKVQTRSF